VAASVTGQRFGAQYFSKYLPGLLQFCRGGTFQGNARRAEKRLESKERAL